MAKIWIMSRSALAPVVALNTADATSAVMDLNELSEGDIILEAHVAAAAGGTTPKLAGKWMEADAVEGPFTDSGLVFADVTDAADVLHSRPLDRTLLKRFGQFVGTITGTDDPAFGVSVSLTAFLNHDA